MLAVRSGVILAEHAHRRPGLDPVGFFQGELSAHGVIKDRRGRVTRHFNAEIEARWDGDTGVLDEWFEFDDGQRQQRIWTLTRLGQGRYEGRAGDVVGPATIRVAGNAMFLDYVLRIPWRKGNLELRIDDRMYLVAPDVLINASVLRKWGLRVGDIQLVIVRHSPAGTNADG